MHHLQGCNPYELESLLEEFSLMSWNLSEQAFTSRKHKQKHAQSTPSNPRATKMYERMHMWIGHLNNRQASKSKQKVYMIMSRTTQHKPINNHHPIGKQAHKQEYKNQQPMDTQRHMQVTLYMPMQTAIGMGISQAMVLTAVGTATWIVTPTISWLEVQPRWLCQQPVYRASVQVRQIKIMINIKIPMHNQQKAVNVQKYRQRTTQKSNIYANSLKEAPRSLGSLFGKRVWDSSCLLVLARRLAKIQPDSSARADR